MASTATQRNRAVNRPIPQNYRHPKNSEKRRPLALRLIEFAEARRGRLPGVKGLGELANVGTAAAIANAVYHATGIRIRRLPIRIESLLSV
jgi:xanthine dehydrogenase YagR molybdenum-binding subunit